jgi:hypothetical protein
MTATQFSLDSWVDFHQPSFYYSLGMIFFNPLFWNIAAQNGVYHVAFFRPSALLQKFLRVQSR